ncbi:MAG: DUF2975 domain-containing protein [Cyclobacteriaceae bacterium]|jgi:hypothetical protein|nr:DUF2975 domain-containing protein [Cyclobacteriaceae bacterium]
MNKIELTPKITLWVVNILIAFIILFGLFIAISVFVAIRPFEKQLPSTEGVAEWRSHSDMAILGYKLDVDHVYTSRDSISEYYKMVSFRIPGAKFSYPTNTDSVKKILKSKNDASNIYASVDLLGSDLTLRIKDTNLQNYLLFGFITMVVIILSLMILWLVNFKKLIKSLSHYETQFKLENVKRLRLLGYILLVYAIGHFIILQVIYVIMIANFEIVSSANINMEYNFQVDVLVFALTLLILSSVFNHGIRIKEDHELTI